MSLGQEHIAVVAGADDKTADTIRTGISPLAQVAAVLPDACGAMGLLSKLRPDLVFLDITRDNSSGIQALKQIIATLPQAKVFLIDPGTTPRTIIEGFRNGAADIIIPGATGKEIRTRVRQVLSRTEGDIHQGRVLTLFSLKGGVGVTTLALNLADSIREATHSTVLFLDLNLFMGDVTAYLDIAPDFTPFELLEDLDRMDKDLLFSSLFRHESGLYIMTARDEINDADGVSGRDVARMILFLQDHFDYIVVDASHQFSRQTLEAIGASDILLALVIQSIPSAKGVGKTLEFLQDIDFKPEALKVVLNRHVKRSEFQKPDLERLFNQKISFVLDNDTAVMNKAVGKGAFLRQSAPNARLTGQIRQMAAGLTGTAPAGAPGWKTLLFGAKR
ncbi:MAG: AAA family ATPase [Desulfobacterales bacterium]|nr:AAA family ATPase [Desulfobacterales bacterium]